MQLLVCLQFFSDLIVLLHKRVTQWYLFLSLHFFLSKLINNPYTTCGLSGCEVTRGIDNRFIVMQWMIWDECTTNVLDCVL